MCYNNSSIKSSHYLPLSLIIDHKTPYASPQYMVLSFTYDIVLVVVQGIHLFYCGNDS